MSEALLHSKVVILASFYSHNLGHTKLIDWADPSQLVDQPGGPGCGSSLREIIEQ